MPASIVLERHTGINVLGEIQDVGQWRIFDGQTLIGYLPYQEDSQILPIVGFNYDETDEIVRQCESERARLGSPSRVIPPMTTLKNVLEAIANQAKEESEDDDD
jgi:hypothetical protein